MTLNCAYFGFKNVLASPTEPEISVGHRTFFDQITVFPTNAKSVGHFVRTKE
jgi:hypothetical protein